MLYEDVESKKYEVYYTVVFKNKKKKLPAKKKDKKETKPNAAWNNIWSILKFIYLIKFIFKKDFIWIYYQNLL